MDSVTGDVVNTVIGEEAHIRSGRENGPRYDPDYPRKKIDTYDNLILLCPTHHTAIDANNGAGISVKDLEEIRSRHETKSGRRKRIDAAVKAYLADRYRADDGVLFEQVDLRGPSVDAMFVDVPVAATFGSRLAPFVSAVAAAEPGDAPDVAEEGGSVVTGGAQALLHPQWRGNAILVGGPGQGKSTLLQFVCQHHRARLLERTGAYMGPGQDMGGPTQPPRVPIRIDLRTYVSWGKNRSKSKLPGKDSGRGKKSKGSGQAPKSWPSLEEYFAADITQRSGGHEFTVSDLADLLSDEPLLVALDGLDEVGNLEDREEVSRQIVASEARMSEDAQDLVVLVATRPGATSSALWTSRKFPILHLRRLTHGLRLQYLQRWAKVVGLDDHRTSKLQNVFLNNQHAPHIRELASYPMQLAILLHLLYRRQLLPQQRTQLYEEYVKTFLDREQGEDKEPLLAKERTTIEDIHAFLAWHLQCKVDEGESAGSIAREELLPLLKQHLVGRDDGLKLVSRLFDSFTTRVLCLVERDNAYQFEVQSLREYFAARYIFDTAPTKSSGNARDDCLTALLQRPYWGNVCRFMVGMLSKGEVRSVRYNVADLSATSPYREHPMLRSMAALLLEDRCFEGQTDTPIREFVDFILDGPGATLAEDGLLEPSGTALIFSEGAGRSQAIKHLQSRLENQVSSDQRRDLAATLYRHAQHSHDDIAAWWWAHFTATEHWVDIAAELRIFESIPDRNQTAFLDAIRSVDCPGWISERLATGLYRGDDEKVLEVIRGDLNAGAGEMVYGFDETTSVWRMATAAAQAVGYRIGRSRPLGYEEVKEREVRHASGGTSSISQVESLAAEAVALRTSNAEQIAWADVLIRLHSTWGSGWVILQTIANLPYGLALQEIAKHIDVRDCDLASLLRQEDIRRKCRGDVAYWRDCLPADVNERQYWLLSLLRQAHTSVVIELSSEIDGAVASLPKQTLCSLHLNIKALGRDARLTLSDALRLNQVSFSPASLWLLRSVAVEGAVVQIDKRLSKSDSTLLGPDAPDLRELVKVVGAQATVSPLRLKDCRAQLLDMDWVRDVRLGALRPTLAKQILREPYRWPPALVQASAAKLLPQISAAPPLSHIAVRDNWFPDR